MKRNGKVIVGSKIHGDLRVPIEQDISNTDKFTQTYDNLFYAIIGLTRCEHILLEFIKIKMQEDNTIDLNARLKREFIEVLQERGIKYSMNTVNIAVSGLKKAYIIIATRSNGSYIVNPRYLAKSHLSDRWNIVNAIKEEQVKLHNNLIV